jgi:hypothetical protein
MAFFSVSTCTCAAPYSDPATNLEVVNINPGNSVASNTIKTIVLDHRQVLWMATEDGLYYLDDKGSRRFMNFRSPISDVAEDNQGRLWVATNKGLQVINPIRNYSIPLPKLGLKASFATSPNIQIERLPNQEMAILAGAHLYRYLPLTGKLIVQCQLPQPEGNVVFNMKYVAKEDAFYLSQSISPLFRIHKNHISNIFFSNCLSKKEQANPTQLPELPPRANPSTGRLLVLFLSGR